jgi:two-component sensor histidine kinase
LVNKLGFQDVTSMIHEIEKDAKTFLSFDNQINFYLNAARLLFDYGEYEESLNYMFLLMNSSRETYSQDLSQTIANYKTREIAYEKEQVVREEKEKSKLYIKFGAVLGISLIFTLILIVKLSLRGKALVKRNQEKETLIQEKDLLMKEIHHRVKNNFELVSTLLELQSYELQNQEAKEKLFEGQARIQSLSLIHNKLYESNQSTSVDMQQYISELAELILKSTNFIDKISVHVQTNNTHLDIDTTVPIGLIINELLTNSCKYAFPNVPHAELKITLNIDKDGFYRLSYQEFGVQPSQVPMKSTKQGLGKILITNLVKQLHGRLESDFTQGAQYEIWFKDKINRKKTA